jgi:hypothetical protein
VGYWLFPALKEIDQMMVKLIQATFFRVLCAQKLEDGIKKILFSHAQKEINWPSIRF